MSFSYPAFLWALTALAIPIIVHLFNFRKTTRIFFSNTRFLEQVRQETTQKRKLKQYLVLASRLSFIFFLVMAFAQPFLPATEQITSGREVTLYLDNSYSMLSPASSNDRALDAAIGFSKEVISLFPPDTRYKLVTNDFAPFSNTFRTGSEVIDLLTQIRLSPISRTFQEVRQRVGTQPQDIFWISDFQKSTTGTIEPMPSDTLQSWRLVPIVLQNAANVLVDSVYLEDPFVVGGQRNTLNVRLRNSGAKAIEGLVLKLAINGVQSGTASINLESNSSGVARFDLAQGMRGWNQAVVSFTEFPVSFDNEFFVTLNFSEKIKVSEVRAADPFVEKVFGNSSLFSFRSFGPGNVDLAVLAQSDVVILNGLDRPDGSLVEALRAYTRNAGTLVVIPSAKPDVSVYRTLINGLASRRPEPLEWQELDKPDYQNPFFENVFEERTVGIGMPRAKPLLEWGSDRSAVLKFRDGTPFLSRIGNTFVLAAPLDPAYSDFQSHALFVPVMYRIAASGHRISQKPYYSLSESIVTLNADSTEREAPVRLTGKQEVVPAQRKTGELVVLEIPRFSVFPGFYFAQAERDTLGLIAFNLDKRESLLEQWTGEEVKMQLGGGNHISLFQSSGSDALGAEIRDRYIGRALWKHALVLALMFLLAEVLLIRFLK